MRQFKRRKEADKFMQVMVTLRRRPRLQRQCNIDKESKHGDKENVAPIKGIRTPGKQPKPLKETPKKPLKDPTSQKIVIKKESVEVKSAQVNSRRSKRSRLDKSMNNITATPVPVKSTEKVAPGGLVYEVGRRKSSNGQCEDEFVLRLNNSKPTKCRPESGGSTSSKGDNTPKKSSNAKKRKAAVSESCATKTKLKLSTESKSEKTNQEGSKISKAVRSKPVAKQATPDQKKSVSSNHPKSPPPSKRKDSKSPLRLSLKREPKSPNQIFKVPRSSCSRKQRVSVEAAADVQHQEQSLGLCSLVLQKKRKSSQGTMGNPIQAVKEVEKNKFPLFAGISPIVPTKKEIEKLESLEKSMNLFECPMSPIQKPDQKSTLNYSDLALKAEIKSLPRPKKTKTRPPKKAGTKAKTSGSKKGKSDKDDSLLKTPLRQTFKIKPVEGIEEDKKEESLLFGDDSEESAGEEGFTMFPLSDKSSWESKSKPTANKSKTKKEDIPQSMDYDKWLKDHQQDYTQFQDLELCIE